MGSYPGDVRVALPSHASSSVGTSHHQAAHSPRIPSLPSPVHPRHPQSLPSTSASTFTCQVEGCGKSFPRKAKLLDHMNVHTGERPYTCSHDGCQASYRSSSKLRAHELRSHASTQEQEKAQSFVCNYADARGVPCQKKFWTRQHLDRHVVGVHNAEEVNAGASAGTGKHEVYQCGEPECEAVFSKRKKLREHIWEAHACIGEGQTKDPMPFLCAFPDCGKRFPTNSKRKAHYKRHTEAHYTCALHSQGVLTFPTWSALQAHMREAHPPTCPYPACGGKKFKNRDNLKMHVRRHEQKEAELAEAPRDVESGIRWEEPTPAQSTSAMMRSFRCDWQASPGENTAKSCTKVFKSLHAMKTHVRVAHLRERPFACPCGKSYGHRHLLKRHAANCAASAQKQDNDNDETPQDDRRFPSVTPDDALDSEDEDDVFRHGGGALPDTLREQPSPHTRKRRASASLAAERPWDRSGASMLQLLTGHSYANVPAADQEPAHVHPSVHKKRRQMRGRVVACPWPKLQALMPRDQGNSSVDAALATPSTECQHCFSRVYDVRRHLRSQHHVELEDAEVRALLDKEEIGRLATPRSVSRAQSQSN